MAIIEREEFKKLKEVLAVRDKDYMKKRRLERKRIKDEKQEAERAAIQEKQRAIAGVKTAYKLLAKMKPVFDRVYNAMAKRVDDLDSKTPEQREAFQWGKDFDERLNKIMNLLKYINQLEVDAEVMPFRRARVYKMLMPFLELVERTGAWKKAPTSKWLTFYKETIEAVEQGETYKADADEADFLLETDTGQQMMEEFRDEGKW